MNEIYVPLEQDRASFGFVIVESQLDTAALTKAMSPTRPTQEFVFGAVAGRQLPDDLVANVVRRVELWLPFRLCSQRIAQTDERSEQLPSIAPGQESDGVVARRPCEMSLRLAIVHDQRMELWSGRCTRSRRDRSGGDASIALDANLPEHAEKAERYTSGGVRIVASDLVEADYLMASPREVPHRRELP